MASFSKVGKGFKIVDNILVGDKEPYHWNGTGVGETVHNALESNPDYIGQVDGITGVTNTYAEMNRKSMKCAVWLKKQGIQTGDIIGLCVGNIMDAYVPLFATFYINAISNPWDDELTTMTARYFLSLTKPKIVFVNFHAAASLREAAKEENLDVKLVVFEETQEFDTLSNILSTVDESEVDKFRCTVPVDAEQTCLICNSSGTTGLPKGTEISHRSLINYVYIPEIMDLRNHVSLWLPPLRWHYGLSLMVKAILDYSTRIVVEHYINDEALCDTIEKYKVTWFGSGPGVPVRLLKYNILSKYSLSSIKVFLVGGSPFKREPQDALRKHLPSAAVVQTYGMTDSGGLSNHQRKDSKPGSCGPVCKNNRIKIIDVESGKVLGPNQTGEIMIKTAYMMTGYYKNPEATATFADAEGYGHSGDLGFYDEDGELFHVGRISEFLIYKSVNVPPQQIEALLETHPGVLEAAVVGVPHDTDDELPMAFVMRVPGKHVTEQELIELVEKNLEYYSRLRAGVKFLDKLPRTSTGKISRKKIKDMAAALYNN